MTTESNELNNPMDKLINTCAACSDQLHQIAGREQRFNAIFLVIAFLAFVGIIAIWMFDGATAIEGASIVATSLILALLTIAIINEQLQVSGAFMIALYSIITLAITPILLGMDLGISISQNFIFKKINAEMLQGIITAVILVLVVSIVVLPGVIAWKKWIVEPRDKINRQLADYNRRRQNIAQRNIFY